MPDVDRIERAREHLRRLHLEHGQWLLLYYLSMITANAHRRGNRLYVLRADRAHASA